MILPLRSLPKLILIVPGYVVLGPLRVLLRVSVFRFDFAIIFVWLPAEIIHGVALRGRNMDKLDCVRGRKGAPCTLANGKQPLWEPQRQLFRSCIYTAFFGRTK